jgi:putative ABC transport system permease protein
MRFLPLVWRNLMRRKLRTLFTLLVILISFLLYAYLAALSAGFTMGVDVAGNDRLVVIHKVSLINLLPVSYEDRIAALPGVVHVGHQTWFGGIYQDPSNFFMQVAVEPERLLALYPEFVVPEAQKQAWLADRMGALVGRATANRFGWKVGDRIPIQATIWRKQDGSARWEFTIDAIYEGAERGVDTTGFFFHYDYFDEARQFGQGLVGWYVFRIDDAAKAPEIARRVDAMFSNSPAETKTTTEKAFAQAFASQIGDVAAIVRAILAAVFFTLLLATANTMAQSVRERTNELAVLKTLGFTNAGVLGLVLLESGFLAVVGGGLGLGLALLLISAGDPTGGFLPDFFLPLRDLLVGVGFVLALGVVAGAFPALRAMRIEIADALRRT